MKKVLICLLCALPLLIGCKDKQESVAPEKTLVPTGREREILNAYNLTADTELGQKKLKKLRDRQEKLDTARERMDQWAADTAARKAEEEGL